MSQAMWTAFPRERVGDPSLNVSNSVFEEHVRGSLEMHNLERGHPRPWCDGNPS